MEDDVKTKTVGLAEAIFLVLLVSFEELAEVAVLLFTAGLGIIIVEAMNAATVALLEMYMLLRGGTGIKRLIVQPLGGLFDGLLGTILPIKTISTMIGIWMINHPEVVEQVAGPVGQVAAGGGKGAIAKSGRQTMVSEANEIRAAEMRRKIAMGE